MNHREKKYSGVGTTKSLGKRKWPFSIELSPSGLKVPGALASHELPNPNTPLLLSGIAQGRLGFTKNTRTGGTNMLDYPGQKVQLYRDVTTQLTCVCISKFMKGEIPDSLQDIVLGAESQDDEPSPVLADSPEHHVAHVANQMSDAELKDFEAEVACLDKPLVIMTIVSLWYAVLLVEI